jgi:hypothetical protein
MKQPVPKFKGIPTNGVMSVNNLGQFTRYLHTLEGKECEIVVKKWRRKRTLPQNAYFHGVVCLILGNHWGYDVDEAHSAICTEFLTVSTDGKPDYVRSTTDLDTAEFNDFLEVVKMWASKEFGVYIPDPEKVDI